MFRIWFWMVFIFIAVSASGQKLEAEAEISVLNRHVWRGSQLGNALAIEPSATVTSGRFSFNVWAAVTTNNSYSEIDLIPSYSFNHFTFTVFDYYNPVPEENNQYLNFQEGKNRHSVELSFDNYSIDKQRFKWMIGTFVLGDKNEETGNPFYSSYLELKYPFTVFTIDAEPFAGLTPFRGYYADKFALINTGISFSKEIDLKLPFTFPLSLSFISNPYSRQSFIIFAGGIAF
ncbi:MAG: hypothetical protein A2066_04285 [Bacteroidetes bacterium GWB2_41_8]|nr:MAG: hypothetical protein A2066_04285 [Bacteroidetes bacterium GWB2_41_8]